MELNQVYQAILENMNEAVYVRDLDKNIMYINPASEKLTGRSFKEALGKKCYEVFRDEEFRCKNVCPAEKAISRKRHLLHHEGKLKTRSGDVKTMQVSISPFSDRENIIGAIIVMEDITRLRAVEQTNVKTLIALEREIEERRHAEDNLKASEEKYRNLFESGSDLLCIHDLEGNLLETNLSYKEQYGWGEIDLRGINIRQFIPDRYKPEFDQYLDRIIQNGEDEGYLRGVTKTGDEVILEYINKLIFDSNGKPTAVFGAARDVTDRKRAENALRDSRNMLQTVLDAIPSAVFWKDRDSIYLGGNRTWLEDVGLKSSAEAVGKSDYDLPWEKAQADSFREDDRRVMGSGIPEYGIIEPYIRADGREAWARTNKVPLRDVKGNVIGIIGTYEDITDRKQAEEERNKLQSRLQQAQKLEAIGNLAGGIAHDFNNILSSIIGYTELALEDVEQGSMLEDCLLEIDTAGKRARDLVKQILAFSRQSDAERKPIAVDAAAKEMIKLLRSTIPTTIEIRQKIESRSLIIGSMTQVNQLFMNLFTNAAQAMEDAGGILEVSLKDVASDGIPESSGVGLNPRDYIEIKVSDTGVGISPDILGLIFEPYFTTKEPGEGTGMGLAIVYGIVEHYGGKIQVDSTLGRGSTFTVYLPIAKQRETRRPYESGALPTGTERILFVDDEASIAKIGGLILERLGYSVTTRTNSLEALELFRVNPNDFDLVITDMTMPNITGDKLATELMKVKPDIPVILCTGYSRKISDEDAAEIGIKAFAYKPIVKADLAKTVRNVLDAGGSGA